MNDDLVKQLRNSKGWPTLGNAAADRIEELEAKLAKAVDAGKTMDDGCDCGRCSKARATLAELTGGKDE